MFSFPVKTGFGRRILGKVEIENLGLGVWKGKSNFRFRFGFSLLQIRTFFDIRRKRHFLQNLLKLKKIQRRFATRFTSATNLQIQFGAGDPLQTDENITPNPENVGWGLPFDMDKLTYID